MFDGKMEVFKRKASLLAGGHVTQMPGVITYSSMITRETVCIAFTMAALDDINVTAADVLNSYVMTLNRENIRSALGQEIGDNACKSAIIIRVLYEPTSAGVPFKAYLAQFMHELEPYRLW